MNATEELEEGTIAVAHATTMTGIAADDRTSIPPPGENHVPGVAAANARILEDTAVRLDVPENVRDRDPLQSNERESSPIS